MSFFSILSNNLKGNQKAKDMVASTSVNTNQVGNFLGVIKNALVPKQTKETIVKKTLAPINTAVSVLPDNVVSKVGTFVKEASQAVARGAVNTARGVANVPISGFTTPKQGAEAFYNAPVTTPKSKLAKAVVGTEPFNFKTAETKTTNLLVELGVDGTKAKKWAPTLVIAGTLGDLFPGTPGLKKAGTEVVKEAGELIAKSKQLPEIVDTLIGVFKISRKDANELAPILRDIEDVGSVKTTIDDFINKKIDIKQPQIKEPVSDFNVDEYIQSNIQKREIARSGNKKNSIGNFFKKIKQSIVESNAPIEDTLNKVIRENNIDLPESKNITNNIDRVLRSNTLAGQFMKDYKLDSIIKEVDDLGALDEYLIAKQAIDVDARGIKTGRDIASDKKLVDILSPKMEKYTAVVNNYTQKMLDYAVDAGIISKENADILRKRYPNYVPLQRIFSVVDEPVTATRGVGGGVANLSKQTVIKNLKGSERQIESPIQSLISKTSDMFLEGEKNKAFQTLVSYKDLPNNPFKLTELNPGEATKGKFIVSGYVNGQKKVFETTKEIAEAAKSLNQQNMGIMGKILSLPVRLLKIGVTGINPAFATTNIVRDQITAFINSEKSLKTSIANPSVFMKALTAAFKHDDLYSEFIRNAAGGTSFDISRNAAKQTVESIRSRRSIPSRALYLVKNPSEILRAVENQFARFEELTRLQQYVGVKEANKSLGEIEASIRGAKAARETTANFSRRGTYGNIINANIPYLNAGIQGSRAFIRSAKRDPAGTALKVASVLLLPEAMNTLWAVSDPQRKAAWDNIADYEKENNYIIIPPNPVQDDQGRWNVIKIPKPPGVANLANLIRRPIEAMHGMNPVKFSEMANSILGTFSPVEFNKNSLLSTLTPQYIRPGLEQFTNKNFFTGSPIIPRSMEGLSPELQTKKDTSGTAKIIGGFLDVSPINVQDFVRGTFGGVGLQSLNAVDTILSGSNIIERNEVGGQSVVSAITDRFTKARGVAEDDVIVNKIKDILQKQVDDRFILKQEAEMLHAELSKMTREDANKKALEIRNKNPELFNKLKDVITAEKRGLTYTDRLIGQLGVENGARAQYIYETAKAIESKDEKNAYIRDLQRKGLVSNTVIAQMKKLIQEGGE